MGLVANSMILKLKLISFFLALLLPALAEADNRLKVGFIAALSGPAQQFGIAARNGFELGRSELSSSTLDVVYEDDQFIPAKSVAAFRKLTEIDKIDVLVVVGSGPGNAVAPLAEAARIPMLAWASDRRVSLDRPHVIRTYPSGNAEGTFIAREVLQRGASRVALVTSVHDYSESWRAGFLAEAGSKVIADEQPTNQTRDFKTQLLRARTADFIGICLEPGQSGVFARQVREMKLSPQIFGCEFLNSSAESESAQGALKGALFNTIFISESFRDRFSKRFGNDSVLSGGAIHYHVASVLSSIGAERGRALIDKLLSRGAESTAMGKATFQQIGNDRFLDVQLVIQEVD